MKKGILVVIMLVVLGGVGAYFYVFHKSHRDPSSEMASYNLQAIDLAQEFAVNQDAANKKYVDQVVEVSGTASEIGKTYIIVDNVLHCAVRLGEGISDIQEGDEITMKGRVIAFDDLLEEVKLDNCVKL